MYVITYESTHIVSWSVCLRARSSLSLSLSLSVSPVPTRPRKARLKTSIASLPLLKWSLFYIPFVVSTLFVLLSICHVVSLLSCFIRYTFVLSNLHILHLFCRICKYSVIYAIFCQIDLDSCNLCQIVWWCVCSFCVASYTINE